MNNSRELTLRFLAQPTDVNFGGKVHGGSIMKWIDEAAYATATGWSQGYAVTAHVGDVAFNQPVSVGSLIEVHAKIVHTGRTSMHISVGLRACDPQHCDLTDAINCIVIFVAVDEDGHPRQVPSWTPVSDDDRALEDYAIRLMELRRKLHADLGELDYR